MHALKERVMEWRSEITGQHEPDHGTADDEFGYAAGWTISGLATLGTIVAVWLFAI
jgi:fumarate reductase subunit D